MKRTFLLLLCLVLLLSGCSLNIETQPPTDSVATMDVSGEAISLLPQPFDFTQEPTSHHQSPIFQLQPPSPTNITVTTDYSHYAPKKEETTPIPRLRQEWIADLEASEDYGHIYPYAGLALYSSLEEDRYLQGYLYGMIDEQGRIVADATYEDIDLLEEDIADEMAMLYMPVRRMPIWVLKRSFRVEEWVGESLYAIATLDGSFVTECKYSYVHGSPDGYVLAVEKKQDGSHRFDLFDLEGTVICRSEDLPILQNSGFHLRHPDFSCGMFLFQDQHPNGERDYYYTDLSGQRLLGPYTSAGLFYDGCAMVSQNESNYYLMDSRGRSLTDMRFSYSYPFHDGAAIARLADEESFVLVNTKGKVLLKVSSEGALDQSPHGFYYLSDRECTYYDSQGKMLYGGPVSSEWRELGNVLFSEGSKIFNIVTGETLDLSERYPHGYVIPGYSFGHPYLFLEEHDYDSGIHRCCILNEDLQIVEDNIDLGYEGYVAFCNERLSRKPYLLVSTPEKILLYNGESPAPLVLEEGSNSNIRIYGDRILCMSGSFCSYYDLSGNLLFRISTSGVGED